jgi:hypothetical protein
MLQVVSMVWGILAILGMIVAFLPCLGSLNWLNIPFSVVGLVVSIVALATANDGSRTGATAGVVCCGIATVFGLIRLMLGGGVL